MSGEFPETRKRRQAVRSERNSRFRKKQKLELAKFRRGDNFLEHLRQTQLNDQEHLERQTSTLMDQSSAMMNLHTHRFQVVAPPAGPATSVAHPQGFPGTGTAVSFAGPSSSLYGYAAHHHLQYPHTNAAPYVHQLANEGGSPYAHHLAWSGSPHILGDSHQQPKIDDETGGGNETGSRQVRDIVDPGTVDASALHQQRQTSTAVAAADASALQQQRHAATAVAAAASLSSYNVSRDEEHHHLASSGSSPLEPLQQCPNAAIATATGVESDLYFNNNPSLVEEQDQDDALAIGTTTAARQSGSVNQVNSQMPGGSDNPMQANHHAPQYARRREIDSLDPRQPQGQLRFDDHHNDPAVQQQCTADRQHPIEADATKALLMLKKSPEQCSSATASTPLQISDSQLMQTTYSQVGTGEVFVARPPIQTPDRPVAPASNNELMTMSPDRQVTTRATGGVMAHPPRSLDPAVFATSNQLTVMPARQIATRVVDGLHVAHPPPSLASNIVQCAARLEGLNPQTLQTATQIVCHQETMAMEKAKLRDKHDRTMIAGAGVVSNQQQHQESLHQSNTHHDAEMAHKERNLADAAVERSANILCGLGTFYCILVLVMGANYHLQEFSDSCLYFEQKSPAWANLIPGGSRLFSYATSASCFVSWTTILVLIGFVSTVAPLPKLSKFAITVVLHIFAFQRIMSDTANKLIGIALLLMTIPPAFMFAVKYFSLNELLDEAQSSDEIKQGRIRFGKDSKRLLLFQATVFLVSCFVYSWYK